MDTESVSDLFEISDIDEGSDILDTSTSKCEKEIEPFLGMEEHLEILNKDYAIGEGSSEQTSSKRKSEDSNDDDRKRRKLESLSSEYYKILVRGKYKVVYNQLWNFCYPIVSKSTRGDVTFRERFPDGFTFEVEDMRECPPDGRTSVMFFPFIGFPNDSNYSDKSSCKGFGPIDTENEILKEFPESSLRNVPVFVLELFKVFGNMARQKHIKQIWKALCVRVNEKQELMVSVAVTCDINRYKEIYGLLVDLFEKGEGKKFHITTLYITHIPKTNRMEERHTELVFGKPGFEVMDGLNLYYPVFRETWSCPYGLKMICRGVEELLAPTKTTTILEVFCGTGMVGFYLSKIVGEVLSYDVEDVIKLTIKSALHNNITGIDYFSGKPVDIELRVLSGKYDDFAAVVYWTSEVAKHSHSTEVMKTLRRSKRICRLVTVVSSSLLTTFPLRQMCSGDDDESEPFIPVMVIPVDSVPFQPDCMILILLERITMVGEKYVPFQRSAVSSVSDQEEEWWNWLREDDAYSLIEGKIRKMNELILEREIPEIIGEGDKQQRLKKLKKKLDELYKKEIEGGLNKTEEFLRREIEKRRIKELEKRAVNEERSETPSKRDFWKRKKEKKRRKKEDKKGEQWPERYNAEEQRKFLPQNTPASELLLRLMKDKKVKGGEGLIEEEADERLLALLEEERRKRMETEAHLAEEQQRMMLEEERRRRIDTEKLLTEEQRRCLETEKLLADEQRRCLEIEKLLAEEQRRCIEAEQFLAEERRRHLESEKLLVEERRRRMECEKLLAEEQKRRCKEHDKEERRRRKRMLENDRRRSMEGNRSEDGSYRSMERSSVVGEYHHGGSADREVRKSEAAATLMKRLEDMQRELSTFIGSNKDTSKQNPSGRNNSPKWENSALFSVETEKSPSTFSQSRTRNTDHSMNDLNFNNFFGSLLGSTSHSDESGLNGETEGSNAITDFCSSLLNLPGTSSGSGYERDRADYQRMFERRHYKKMKRDGNRDYRDSESDNRRNSDGRKRTYRTMSETGYSYGSSYKY